MGNLAVQVTSFLSLLLVGFLALAFADGIIFVVIIRAPWRIREWRHSRK